MLNVAELRERVASEFPDATQVADTVVRFIRRAHNQPFAVCYLDIAKELPATPQALTKYQDEIIGKHYFEGRKSLQWSNYLYFVTTPKRLASEEIRRARALIEADRSYARKFVISEDDIDDVLSPPAVAAPPARGHSNILSIWTQRLIEARLDGAILSDADLPARIAWIEAPRTATKGQPPIPARTAESKPLPFIKSLELKRYRPYPLQKEFQFGTVNLIFGHNATGKTSLLEAIELYYCGLNKRTPKKSPTYELSIVLADNRRENATSARKATTFREKNLAWYGRPEVRTNELYQSFAQFNFLDTDAAVSIAESTLNIEDDLSKLLVGPDASRVWRNMERVRDELEKNLRGVRQLDRQVNDERKVLESTLKAAEATKQESDLIAGRLTEMLQKLGWGTAKASEREEATGRIVSSLTEMISIAEQGAELAWVESPVTFASMKAYCASASESVKKAEPAVERLKALAKTRRGFEESVLRATDALTLANQAMKIAEARIIERLSERSSIAEIIAQNASLTAGIEPDPTVLISLSATGPDRVDAQLRAAQARRAATEQELTGARAEYTRFAALRERSQNLTQQLRQIASEVLSNVAEVDECPLCHTTFGPGELAQHMAMGVDQHLDSAGKELLDRINAAEAALAEANAIEAAVSALSLFVERCKLAGNVTVSAAVTRLTEVQQAVATSVERANNLDREIRSLEAQGLSQRELVRISARLAELGYPLSEQNPNAAAKLIASLSETLARNGKALRDGLGQIDKQETEIQRLLGTPERGPEKLGAELAALKEQTSTTTGIVERLAAFFKSYVWPAKSTIAELVINAKSVRTVASQLQAVLMREKRDRSIRTESVQRKERLDRQASELKSKIGRLDEARTALSSLIKDHSLTSAMSTALGDNRAAIETIFSRIHAPPEFSGIGRTFDTLIRRTDSSEAKLGEISTGQRAALALSIFLAQNNQLSNAPPVVLIDDPIAHVDDLNSLSFLDYLRDVAINGHRQIFFATANDKIATLLERKFDFLGEQGFRKIELARDRVG